MSVKYGKIALTQKNNPFSTERIKTSNKFVGGYVPQQTAEYIILLAILQGCSVNKLLRSILASWIKNKLPMEKVMESLTKKANANWIKRYQNSKGKPKWKTRTEIAQRHIEYKKELRKILIKKKISMSIIDKILNGVKHEEEQ